MARKAVNKVPAFVDALVAVGTRRLEQVPGCSPDQALQAMNDIAGSICGIYAKTQMYVPANIEAERQKRDGEIRLQYGMDGPTGAGKFTASRLQEVARDFDLTIAHAYEIVRAPQSVAKPAPEVAKPAPPSLVNAWSGQRPAALCGADEER